METLIQDLRFAVRGLLKRPGFSLVIIVTLALGIGANTAIFSVVHAVLLAPLPYPEPSQLVVLSQKNTQKNLSQQPTSYPNLRDWQAQNQCFTHLAALRGEAMSLTDGTEPERVSVLRSSVNILSLLGVMPALGRDFRPDEEEPGKATVALIGHGLWQRRYGGNPNLVGQTITLDGRAFTVIGIMPARLKHPGLVMSSLSPTGADVWIPLVPLRNEQERTFSNLRAIARLKPGTSLAQAQAEMTAVAVRLEQQFPNINVYLRIDVEPLHEHLVGRVQQGLWILTGAVLFVLLIACANVANLLLARATARQTEIAIRTALGATRGALMRQLLTECVVLSLLGGGVGLLLAAWGVPVLTKLSGIPRVDEVGHNAPVLMFALLISLATGLVFGLLPAWQSSRTEISGTLKEGRKGSGVTHRRWLSALVVSEIALALVLLIGAGLLLRSFRAVSAIDPGFRVENVLTLAVPLPAALYPEQAQQVQFFERVFAAINALPGVESSAMTFRLPIIGFATAIFTAQGKPVPAGQEAVADYRAISPAYFRTLGIPLLQGREFSDHDNAEAADAIIINEELARRTWPGESPLGKRLQIATERTRW
ncbi:MAG TPA: ABC transporter permease, partial [Blastocatellia bacterium]|nr:ABC transporter permease [Blastocatellia bacterium]